MDADSKQEQIVEALMAQTFGAPFLFRPDRYRKKKDGKKQEQSADLAWRHGNLIALFYLNKSIQSIDKQIDHNQRQPHRYVRLWASRDPRFVLTGTNRFGDRQEVPFDTFDYLITVSIVSAECGVRVFANRTFGKKGFTLVLSDSFVQLCASNNCTFVDILILARVHMTAPNAAAEDEGQRFVRLIVESQAYVAQCNTAAQRVLRDNCPVPDPEMFARIFQPLAAHKMPPGFGHELDQEGRRIAATIFADMALSDYLTLVYGVAYVLHKSEAPAFNRWVAARVRGRHHDFVLFTVRLASKNTPSVVDEAMNLASAGKLGNGRECLSIGYANVLDSNDYHTPFVLAFPGKVPPIRSCAEQEVDAILAVGPNPGV